MIDSKRIIFIILIVMCFFGCDFNIKNDFYKDEEVKKRVGMLIKLNPEFIEVYKQLHSDNNPGVRDLLRKYGMRNFSIFLYEITPGEFYEFGYYEYVGDDFKKDMDAMAKERRTIEWLKVCDPMQLPLEGSASWTEMERVYFNE